MESFVVCIRLVHCGVLSCDTLWIYFQSHQMGSWVLICLSLRLVALI